MRETYQQDLDRFVPAIESIFVTWCDTLAVRLNDDTASEWTEGFLNIVSEAQAHGLKLRIQVCAFYVFIDCKPHWGFISHLIRINPVPPHDGIRRYPISPFIYLNRSRSLLAPLPLLSMQTLRIC